MVARGGADNKGQHLANILGALDAARAGTLRWRVRIILDGEEEHGSPNLGDIARAHRERLGGGRLGLSDGPKQKNRPTLVMGVRGMLEAHLGVGERPANRRPLRQLRQHRGEPGAAARPADRGPRERVTEFARDNGEFRREAETAFAQWEREAVWTPFLWPTSTPTTSPARGRRSSSGAR